MKFNKTPAAPAAFTDPVLHQVRKKKRRKREKELRLRLGFKKEVIFEFP
jgi:hypothetical protein